MKLLLTFALGCLLSSSTQTAHAAAPTDSTDRTVHWQALAEELRQIGADEQLPGMGIVLFDAGHPVVISTSWEHSSPFRWGSITKTLTALTALSLCDSGQLDLDDPVRTYLPEGVYANPWASSRPLRLRHLLEHSAGLPDLSSQEWNSNEPVSLTDALQKQIRPLLWPPGLQHSYSNVAPGLTAAVIEAAGQDTFARLLRERVLLPLGMDNARLDEVPGLPGGFQADGSTELPYWHMTFPAFGALNASLPEMAEVVRLLLQRGYRNGQRLFSEATINAMFAPGSTLAVGAGLQVGYGAGLYSWISRGHQFWGHGGDADGYLSRFGLLPGAGRGYLIAINTDRPELLRRLQRRLEQALTLDLAAPSLPRADTTVALDAYTGHYYPSAARFNVAEWQSGKARRAVIERQGDQLLFRRDGRSTLLTPVGPARFRRADDPVVTLVFASDADGSQYLQGELGNFVKTDHCPGFIPECHQ